ncbi:MAG TPA: transglutaminase family protein [Usitatibacter sp.]|jgi:transglutaminase-like putative cysteine protease|nr:transglutaminase family protein [Usitatibacter sp.]
MIRFDLSIGLDYTVQSPTDFVFVVQPTATPYQRVTWESLAVRPELAVESEIHGAPGNRHLRVHAEPGPFELRYDAIVDLVHHLALPEDLHEVPISELAAPVIQYIYPSRYCQSDQMLELARREFGSHPPGYGRVEAIRQWVQGRTKFQAGSSHAGTSALDTYTCGAGVCRDFAHLMIAMCRALNIPARFATGIDYGADPALGPTDFHCYVEAFLGDRWYVFDPSGISPRMGLLRIGTGRDASDVAFATIFGSVQWTMPRIRIRAEGDELNGIVEPVRHDYAVSTDSADAEPDEVVAQLQGPGGVLQGAAPSVPAR